MVFRRPRSIRYAVVLSCFVALISAQLPGLVSRIVGANSSEGLLSGAASNFSPTIAFSGAAVPYAPFTTLCVPGTLDNATDLTYNRPSTLGFATSCILTGAFTLYDAYTFNVSGCTNPSVTVSTCTGPCGTQGPLDTVVYIYQKAGGAAASPGSPIFSPAAPCTNGKAANNDACGVASQLTTTLQTTASTGDFVVVVASNSPFTASPSTFGPYNLRVDAPACVVTQTASCIYAITPAEQSFLAAGASSSVTVTTGATCAWTAVSNDAFITIGSGSSGLGNGVVNYTVAANTGPARTGTMTIADSTFKVTQEAGAVSLPCIQDALVSGNPTFSRPNTVGNPPSCAAPVRPIVFYKAYEFTLSGCLSGPVTASTCGTSPCSGVGTLADTILYIYRKSSGAPSTPGSPIFDPVNPCVNVISGNNDFCGTRSQVTSNLNAGSFVVVVASNGAGQTGTFNLGVTASGCTVSFVPPCSSITGTVSGGGTICAGGSSTITVTLSGGTPPYTATLNNGGGTQTGSSPLNFSVSPSSTTTYSVTSATDSAGCSATVSGSATVTVNQAPTTADAGPDQTVCSTSATLAGNTPTVGTGTWSLISGSGTIASPNSPNSGVTNLAVGANVFRWTIANGVCPDSTDDVTISRDATPTTANAGPDQTVCSTSATLAGNAPAVGTGTWTVVSGSGTITSPNSPTTTVTGLGAGANVFRWTISNGTCPASSDDVTINRDEQPTTATAGSDQNVCGTTATLAANAPTVGTGTWTVVSGTGTFADSHSPTTSVSGLSVGANVFRWTITNGVCPASSDDVTITRDATPPVISCPANITTQADPGVCSAVVNFTVTAADNCPVTIVANPPSGSAFPIGTTTVNATATDQSGNSSTCSFTVTVTNPNPLATITGPPTGSLYQVGTAVTFTGTYTDAGGGTHTANWNFTSNSENINVAGTVTEPSGSTPGTVTTTYTFNTSGVYLVTLTVTDSCGGTGTANTVDGLTALVVIYDPDGGFVTGGGWINSPAGAYVPNPTLADRASFGFVSKYQHGAQVPTGNTEFQFRVANFNFKSTVYEWLVIAGARAQYKGSGTVNGSGDYRFILTAIDGQVNGGGGVDKFRIRIWNNNGGGLVYDNQFNAPDSSDPTTVLGGGSIVIHH